MEEKKRTENPANVPYYIYEGAMVRAERYFKRAIIALIVVIGIALIAVGITILVNNHLWMKHIEKNYTPVEVTGEP